MSSFFSSTKSKNAINKFTFKLNFSYTYQSAQLNRLKATESLRKYFERKLKTLKSIQYYSRTERKKIYITVPNAIIQYKQKERIVQFDIRNDVDLFLGGHFCLENRDLK